MFLLTILMTAGKILRIPFKIGFLITGLLIQFPLLDYCWFYKYNASLGIMLYFSDVLLLTTSYKQKRQRKIQHLH